MEYAIFLSSITEKCLGHGEEFDHVSSVSWHNKRGRWWKQIQYTKPDKYSVNTGNFTITYNKRSLGKIAKAKM